MSEAIYLDGAALGFLFGVLTVVGVTVSCLLVEALTHWYLSRPTADSKTQAGPAANEPAQTSTHKRQNP